MDRFWKAALGVAGIGAIGFFVFWSLYKQWLSLSIFPMLTQDQAFQLLKYFLFLTFAALLLGVVAYIVTHKSKKKEKYVPIKSDTLKLPNGSKFTDEQFETYKMVWVSLQNVRASGDALWKNANKKNLDFFAETLRKAIELIDNGAIFFHNQDYIKIKEILHSFAQYQGGKELLIDLRDSSLYDLEQIRSQIAENERHLSKYSDLLEEIRVNYHDRLSWKMAS
jgi:hypothetical protein